MSGQNTGKLNQLERSLPEGLLVDASWLEKRGYSRSLRSHYVSAGWLEQPTRGVFRRPRGELGWEQVVISLQTLLEYPVSVGGRTALEMEGYAHYLSHVPTIVHLYSDVKLPSWLFKLRLEQTFIVHNRLRFLPQTHISVDMKTFKEMSVDKESALLLRPWGHWNWPLVLSTPERAYLELLEELPDRETFHLADVMMEGLVNLSPRRMQLLLENTSSIKVKRLFFFFAERHHHRWMTGINSGKVDFGAGKRMLAKGGKYIDKYQITVPTELLKDDQNGF